MELRKLVAGVAIWRYGAMVKLWKPAAGVTIWRNGDIVGIEF